MLPPATLIAGRYTVTRRIGQGGAGAVYEATDQRLATTVALKQILLQGAAGARMIAAEAQLLARLRHPALPVVIDSFAEGPAQFLVLQFIAGPTLHDLLRTHPTGFPVDAVLGWARTLCDVLIYLHTQSPPVLHRDIKPSNIKLTPAGDLVLLDFGLARNLGAVSASSATAPADGYSLSYAPLEQLEGRAVDQRADVYALAATLYHLLSGVAPPSAADRAVALLRHQPDPLAALHIRCPGLPAALDAALMQSLALRAEQRPPTVAALRDLLQIQPTAISSVTQATLLPPQTAQSPIAPLVRTPAPEQTTVRWGRAEGGWWMFFNGLGGVVGAITAGIILIPLYGELNALADAPDQAEIIARFPALIGQLIGAIAISSTTMATVQWAYLRTLSRLSAAWVAASVIGMLLGSGVGVVVGVFALGSIISAISSETVSHRTTAFMLIFSPLALLLTMSSVGGIVAFLQQLVLQRTLGHVAGWGGVTTIGLLVGMLCGVPVGWGVGMLLSDRLALMAGLIAGGFVYAVVSSAITGVALARHVVVRTGQPG